jgi:hypothetical protein
MFQKSIASAKMRRPPKKPRRENLRSCTSLAALTFESANALLAPFRPHLVECCVEKMRVWV